MNISANLYIAVNEAKKEVHFLIARKDELRESLVREFDAKPLDESLSGLTFVDENFERVVLEDGLMDSDCNLWSVHKAGEVTVGFRGKQLTVIFGSIKHSKYESLLSDNWHKNVRYAQGIRDEMSFRFLSFLHITSYIYGDSSEWSQPFFDVMGSLKSESVSEAGAIEELLEILPSQTPNGWSVTADALSLAVQESIMESRLA